mmetsp:Transcript_56360/g.142554  ORF Transcript_56360/g.142554 Transcript_56360/m.142554 type:complete len:306 (+) Transcript_56360:1360-2277(+)
MHLDQKLVLLHLQLRGLVVILQPHCLLLGFLGLPELRADVHSRLRDGGQLPQLHPRTRLVHHVDGLVRQETVLDVLRSELHTCLQSCVRVLQAVVGLVLSRQTVQDLNRLLYRRLRHGNRLKTALQRLVLFDVLSVLLDRGSSDNLQVASRQCRLQDVGCVHGASATIAACANKSVDLVNHQDDVSVLSHLLDDVLEALLEFATVLRTGKQHAQVQLNDFLVQKHFWHVTFYNAPGQALCDSRLANARLAHEHGVIFLPPGKDLDRPLNLLLAANEGVHLAGSRGRGEVLAELLERCLATRSIRR